MVEVRRLEMQRAKVPLAGMLLAEVLLIGTPLTEVLLAEGRRVKSHLAKVWQAEVQ